ncbi:WecB/TagA/CpsF family glycosyltransferase [Vibrio sp. MA40-2]|uniref:WecB/TagA/CpsF family glycosyltransferase n=1 Tax=Vibrio sp. MA40-2 TaxID=3391828 RepID=UPI0039A51016
MKKSRRILGLEFCTENVDNIVDIIVNEQVLSTREDQRTLTQQQSPRELQLLVTPNVDHVVTMTKDPQFKELCQNAWLLTADGFPVVKLLRYCDVDIPGRITGADLFPAIMDRLTVDVHSPFFVCSSTQTAEFLSNWLNNNGFSNAEQRVVVPDFGFENDPSYNQQLIQQINALDTTHLFFGVGAPKSEKWMYTYRNELPNMLGFGFGAGLDFFAGVKKRAPLWVQNIKMEWFWRLSSEPKRLAKRYLVNSWVFLGVALKEMKQHKRGLS